MPFVNLTLISTGCLDFNLWMASGGWKATSTSARSVRWLRLALDPTIPRPRGVDLGHQHAYFESVSDVLVTCSQNPLVRAQIALLSLMLITIVSQPELTEHQYWYHVNTASLHAHTHLSPYPLHTRGRIGASLLRGARLDGEPCEGCGAGRCLGCGLWRCDIFTGNQPS